MTVFKKFAVYLIVGLVCFPVSAYAAETRIVVEGEEASLSSQIYSIDGYNFAPLGEIMRVLGAEVSWDGNTKTVTAKREDREIRVEIGSLRGFINDSEVTLATAPRIIDDITYVPVGFIGEALGYNVSWQPDTKTVSLEARRPEGERFDINFKQRYDTNLEMGDALSNTLKNSSDLKTLSRNMRDLRDARDEYAAQYGTSAQGTSALSPIALAAASAAINDAMRSALSQLDTMNITLENERYQRQIIEGAASLAVRSSFYNIKNYENTIAQTDAQIELMKRNLDNSRLAFELGMLSATEYEKLELAYKQLLEGQEVNKRALDTEYLGLNKLMGYGTGERYNVVLSDKYEPVGNSFDIEYHIRKQLGGAPNIKISESSLREAESKLKLFTGNTQLEYDKAVSAVEAASMSLEDTKRSFENSIRSMYATLKNLETQITAKELDFEREKTAEANARVQYETGNITELKLLEQFFTTDKTEKEIEQLKRQHSIMRFRLDNPYLS